MPTAPLEVQAAPCGETEMRSKGCGREDTLGEQMKVSVVRRAQGSHGKTWS